MKIDFGHLLVETRQGLTMPSNKQKASIARYAHSLSAVCVVAAVSFAFGAGHAGGYLVLKTTALALWGVLQLFLGGLLISKGE